MLLGAIVASGVGMFVLARHLTGSPAGAVIAGVVFAFAPYRFDHYHHLELQWTVWSPWAFWALQRSIETRLLRFGLLMGVFAALQLLSSVYYGVFLVMVMAAVAFTQLIPLRGRELVRGACSVALSGAIVVPIAALYSLPYSKASARVGLRSSGEATTFSARPRDYTAATPTNLLYGSGELSVSERRLFPGLVAPLLALVGLLLVRPTPVAISYLIGLLLAFELSLGFFGTVYPLLYENLGALRGLRAPARASIFCLLCLAVLAAYGTAALTRSLTARIRTVVAALVCGIVLLEYLDRPPEPRALSQQAADSLLGARPASPRCRRRVPDAPAPTTAAPRSAVRVHVDLSLDAPAERVQRLLSGVVYEPAENPGQIPRQTLARRVGVAGCQVRDRALGRVSTRPARADCGTASGTRRERHRSLRGRVEHGHHHGASVTVILRVWPPRP